LPLFTYNNYKSRIAIEFDEYTCYNGRGLVSSCYIQGGGWSSWENKQEQAASPMGEYISASTLLIRRSQ